MSGNRWQMDGYEFTLATEAMGRDRLPYPLRFKPQRMDLRQDFHRYQQQHAQRLTAHTDERFHRAMTVLLEPEVRVEIVGFFGAGRAQVARVYAGISGQHAAMALQKPGPAKDYGADIIVTEHRPPELAAQIAARLPAQRPGTQRQFQGYRADLNAPITSTHPTRLSPQEHTQRFFRRPRTGAGEITVYPGYTLDSRPTPDGLGFHWLDYPDDGRYLLLHHRGDQFTITPGTPEAIAHHIQARISQLTNRPRANTW